MINVVQLDGDFQCCAQEGEAGAHLALEGAVIAFSGDQMRD